MLVFAPSLLILQGFFRIDSRPVFSKFTYDVHEILFHFVVVSDSIDFGSPSFECFKSKITCVVRDCVR